MRSPHHRLRAEPLAIRLEHAVRGFLRVWYRLLVAAGYAPTYQERSLDAPDLAVARELIQQVLRGHEPYPALALDRRWNVLLTNSTADVFLDGVDPALLEPPVNMMRLGMHPRGLAPRVRNLPEIRGYLLPRLARQARRTGDPELGQRYDELAAYGPPVEPTDPDPAAVALTIRLDYHGEELQLFSTVTTFGAVFDITLDEIAVEAYFPADEPTARILHAHHQHPPADRT